jgi:hypothetical protein
MVHYNIKSLLSFLESRLKSSPYCQLDQEEINFTFLLYAKLPAGNHPGYR